ncbi:MULTISPECIES: AbrB family transcriptional regulator [unclassified Bacillus (in: firmicutes)]|uniref:AbrB family transcriptional regulator n=1 Tax=Bacillus TaxID=1386 RepID=UPI0025B554D6|nr:MULTISPECIES: AbrB family transcriptional regulator [unclassified Bacillus (in: firmicutes)]MDN0191346.1 AbrB family transcriptional regulator [Bacillus sp. B.PNR1]MDN3032252.1 AbrB family transcriptional regulator [Bacillus sp. B.PNR2]
MKKDENLLKDLWFIAISAAGGFILSLTGISIGWMIGTLIVACCLAMIRPAWLMMAPDQKGINRRWLALGQMILGIELGQKLNLSVLSVLKDHWFSVGVMLILSILLAMLSGYVLWRFSKTDMMTSFVGTAPGGLSAMPSIAQEVGANTAIVSLVQMMRVLLVVLSIPFLVIMIYTKQDSSTSAAAGLSSATTDFRLAPVLWTVILILAAWGACKAAKCLKFPAPWLLGSMLGVAIVHVGGAAAIGHDMTAWWPSQANHVSQVFLGATIGSKMYKSMFAGVTRIIIVGFISSVGLIAAMFLSAVIVSELTGISLITSVLAFAPGGIAEMATTSVTLHADSTFVVAVQVIRVILVIALLPPFYRLLHHLHGEKKGKEGSISSNA